MARRRSAAPRYVSTIATPRVRLLPTLALPTLSDRRVFDFERLTRPAYVSVGARRAARQVAAWAPPRISGVPAPIAFADPRRVDLCRRREVRKRVFHAKGYAGGRVRKPRHFNAWSKVRC